MPFWSKYDIRDDRHEFLFKYLQTDPEGVKNWFRYKICRFWHGNHDFGEQKLKYPTPFRPQTCKRCGVRWFWAAPPPPARTGYTKIECPHCFMVIDHNPDEKYGKCWHCGGKYDFTRCKK